MEAAREMTHMEIAEEIVKEGATVENIVNALDVVLARGQSEARRSCDEELSKLMGRNEVLSDTLAQIAYDAKQAVSPPQQ